MERSVYRILPDDRRAGTWKLEHNGEILSTHEIKAQAVAAGWQLANLNQPGQIVIHTSSGQIENEHICVT